MRWAYVLIAGMAAGGALAIAGVSHDSAASAPAAPAAAAPAAVVPDENAATGSPAAPAGGQGVEGEVLETIDAARYTYLRLGEKGSAGTWAAVPKAPIAVGSRARIGGATEMRDFRSETLKRTFDSIYFGVLEDGSAAAKVPATTSPHGANAPPNPHGTVGSAPTPADVGKVARVAGPDGRTVAEVLSGTDLGGKRVKVRAVVVKRVDGVLGHTWLHVKDGSGKAAGGEDLVVTTNGSADVGKTVVIEGVVTRDKDLGSGYRYTALIEDAVITTEP